jgi:hypothetical protein
MKANILLALSVLVLSGGLASADDHGGKVAWVREPEFGLAKARLEGRATMLFFTADW